MQPVDRTRAGSGWPPPSGRCLGLEPPSDESPSPPMPHSAPSSPALLPTRRLPPCRVCALHFRQGRGPRSSLASTLLLSSSAPTAKMSFAAPAAAAAWWWPSSPTGALPREVLTNLGLLESRPPLPLQPWHLPSSHCDSDARGCAPRLRPARSTCAWGAFGTRLPVALLCTGPRRLSFD